MANFWDGYKDQVAFSDRNELPIKLLLPKVSALDAFEAETGFRLLTSYRDFVLTFGSGYFDSGPTIDDKDTFRVFVPGAKKDHYNLAKRAMKFRQGAGNWGNEEARQFVNNATDPHDHLIIFCEVDSVGYYAWDPTEVLDPERHEYAIHFRGEHFIERTTHNFTSLVLEEVFGGLLLKPRPGLKYVPPPPRDYDADIDAEIYVPPVYFDPR